MFDFLKSDGGVWSPHEPINAELGRSLIGSAVQDIYKEIKMENKPLPADKLDIRLLDMNLEFLRSDLSQIKSMLGTLFLILRATAITVVVFLLIAGVAFAQDADGGSSDSVSPDGPDSTVTVSDYGG